MGELMAIGFDDEADARSEYERIERMWDKADSELFGVAYVAVSKSGRARVETPRTLSEIGHAAVGSLVLSAVVGLIFPVAGVGLLAGAISAGIAANGERSGIRQEVRDRIRALIPPGHFGFVTYSSSSFAEKLASSAGGGRGTVVRVPWNAAEEAEFRSLLSDSAVYARAADNDPPNP